MLSADLSLLRENVTEGVVPVTDSAGDFSFSGVNSEKPEFRAAVGLSRKWDAREAGREVAIDTLNKLGAGVKPDFFLLFSTIHYEKWGGFKEFLNGVWDILPEGTPLIGGTVAGFMNNYGCYTRGATALAVSYPNMDVAVGVGHNTKRAPHIAAKECAGMIKKDLNESKYKTGYIFSLISGGLVPQILGMGRKKVISGIWGKLGGYLSGFSLNIFQRGIGREEEVLEKFVEQLDRYYILEGSSMDDGKAMNNYQFIGDKIETNSIVAIGIKTDMVVDIGGVNKLKDVKKFSANKLSLDGRVIEKINGEPAVMGFLNLLNWPKEYLDEGLFRKTFFYPLGFKQGQDWVGTVIGIVLGNSIVVLHKIKSQEMSILSADSKTVMNLVDGSLKSFENKKLEIGLISTCDAILEGMGSQIFWINEQLMKLFGDTPFIALYCGGEGTYRPGETLKYGNVTFNVSAFWH